MMRGDRFSMKPRLRKDMGGWRCGDKWGINPSIAYHQWLYNFEQTNIMFKGKSYPVEHSHGERYNVYIPIGNSLYHYWAWSVKVLQERVNEAKL